MKQDLDRHGGVIHSFICRILSFFYLCERARLLCNKDDLVSHSAISLLAAAASRDELLRPRGFS